MRLSRLHLRNHRNYAQLDLSPGPGVNVFIGANGQGKTNLLEAVAMLALSSSPRARRELELVGPLGTGSRIEGEVEAAGRRVEIVISLEVDQPRTHRTVEVDGARRRAVDLPGRFRVSLFWPDDLALVKAGPELRRRFLNQMLVQIEPGYARALAGLRRILEQRNSLLKQMAAGAVDGGGVLDVWDRELVKVAFEISAARAAAVAELGPDAARYQSEIGGEELEVGYEGPPHDLEEAVHNSRAEDLRRGSTSVGPHRDDLRLLLAGREARSYGSQGQQRTAVVSLKLAEAALITRRTGERPVLLLDDVLSELDGERRSALLQQVAGAGQVIITSVEGGQLPTELMSSSAVWVVESGRITSCG